MYVYRQVQEDGVLCVDGSDPRPPSGQKSSASGLITPPPPGHSL